MFSPNVLEMFEHLVDNGIDVSLHKREDGIYYADLHSLAKSHLHVFEQNDKVVFDMRYGRQVEVSSEEDAEALLYQAAYCFAYLCICGRSFGNHAWNKLCRELDITVCYGDL